MTTYCFIHTAPSEIYTLSLHDALPISAAERTRGRILAAGLPCVLGHADFEAQNLRWHGREVWAVHDWDSLAWQPEAALARSEEHTSELQSQFHLVCRLLLEKKKSKTYV